MNERFRWVWALQCVALTVACESETSSEDKGGSIDGGANGGADPSGADANGQSNGGGSGGNTPAPGGVAAGGTPSEGGISPPAGGTPSEGGTTPPVGGVPPSPGGDTPPAVDCEDRGGREGLNPQHFLAGGLVSPIEETPCTLSNGDEAVCYRIEVKGEPADHEVGPFCPRNISDGAEAGGLWIERGQTWDLDGAFIAGLAEFYNDDEWLLYDPETGAVNVTDTQESCVGAARPNVDPQYQNHCVECSLEYTGGGVAHTFLVPKVPVARAQPAELAGMGQVGPALNGGYFDAPAPVQAILAAHTIAAFDDCGGHINMAAGYHYHAATGCTTEVPQCDGHAPVIGYALDGYAIHAMLDDRGDEPADLDACRGHADATRGYHYHSAGPGENYFIGCFHGEVSGDAGGGMMMPPGPGGDLPSCAETGMQMRCCGDDVCDGPETAANCAADCG